MQNIPYNSTQNILNISQELGLTIPEAQALVNQGMRGVQQGPLDMLVKELSNKASADAYRQLQAQVFKQAPKNIPIGQVLGNLSKMTRPIMNVGIPVGQAAMNNRYIPDVKYDLRPARNYAPLRTASQKIGDGLKSIGGRGLLALEKSLPFLDFAAAVEAAKQSDNLTDIVRQGAGNTGGLPDLSTATFTGAKVIEPLPQIQVNQNGSPSVTLQGRVNYDDYILEPLGDDVYMQRMPDERFNN